MKKTQLRNLLIVSLAVILPAGSVAMSVQTSATVKEQSDVLTAARISQVDAGQVIFDQNNICIAIEEVNNDQKTVRLKLTNDSEETIAFDSEFAAAGNPLGKEASFTEGVQIGPGQTADLDIPYAGIAALADSIVNVMLFSEEGRKAGEARISLEDVYTEEEAPKETVRFVSELLNESEVLKADIKDMEQKVESLTADKDSLSNAIEKLNEDLELKTEEISGLKEEVSAKIEEITALSKESEAKTKENTTLTESLTAKTTENEELSSMLKEETAKSDDLAKKLETKTTEGEKLKKDLETKTSESEKLSKDLETKTSEGEKLTKELEAKTSESEKLAKDLETKTAEGEKLTKELEAKTSESEKLAKDLETKTAEGEELTKKLEAKTAEGEKLTKELEAKTAEGEDLTKKLEAKTAEGEKLAKQLEAKTQENEDLAKQLEEKTAEGEDLTKQLEAKTAEGEDLTKQLEAKTAEGEDLTKQLEAKTTEGEDLAKQLEAKTAESEKLQDELKLAKEDITELQGQVRTMEAENGRLRLELDPGMMENPQDLMTDTSIEYHDWAAVKAIQMCLNDAGFDCGPVDCIYGPKTERGIREYQAARGLTENGIITEELVESLKKEGLMSGTILNHTENDEYYTYLKYNELSYGSINLVGTRVAVTGKILQNAEAAEEGYAGYLRLAVRGENEDVLFVTYHDDVVGTDLSEGALITVYGRCVGYYSYESKTGEEVEIPWMMGDNIETAVE